MTFGERPVVWMERQRPETVTPADAVGAWLRGEGPRPAFPPPPRRRPPLRAVPIPSVPHDAALVVVGWQPWAAALPDFLARRTDIRVVAVPGRSLAWEWPEYADPGALASRDTDALLRVAPLTLWPDAAAMARFVALHRDGTPRGRIAVEPEPSALAETALPTLDPALEAVPYVVAVGPIEARANTLLLLQLWRAALAAAPRPDWPKLVLAGERGRQIEEVAPLLDWNKDIRAHVVEAPGLSGQALRGLLHHARALLAPDFVPHAPALLRDAAACGVPLLVADTPDAPRAGAVVRLDPLDGPGWHRAIASLTGAAWSASMAPASLPSWAAWRQRIEMHARQLP